MKAKHPSTRVRPWGSSSSRAALTAVVVAAAVAALPSPGRAQGAAEYRISQRATVSQRLARTLVTIDYSRPLARGRSSLFGEVVRWGEVWTPGANEATVLDLSTDATIDGETVPAGRWSVWMIPSQVGPWEVVLDPRDSLFHTQRPEPTDEQIRFTVEPERRSGRVEALTWSFPSIAHNRATLEMAWGATAVAMQVEVESARPELAVAADEAAKYVGEWVLMPEPGPMAGPEPRPVDVPLRRADDGSLHLTFPPGAFGPPPGAAPEETADPEDASLQEAERAEARKHLAEEAGSGTELLLVPRAPGIFVMGWIDRQGELLDVENVFFEFDFEGGRAVGFAVRGENDAVFARATRRE